MLLAPPNRSRSAARRAVRAVVAIALISVASANVMTALTPHPWQQAVFLEAAFDLDAVDSGREGVLLLALLLLLVARALLRGKRHAWLIAVALLVFSTISAALS